VVRINGLLQVTAGLGLATGSLPRAAALLLAASLVPTTLAGHRFWDHSDAEDRFPQLVQFLKNAGLLGGLLLVTAGQWERARP
jgi:putative oxidoreductase